MARNLTFLLVAVAGLMLVPTGCGDSLPAPSSDGAMTEAEKRLQGDMEKLSQQAQAQNAKAARRPRR